MQFFYWIILLMAAGIAILAIQNSTAPTVAMKFLVWSFKAPLIYTVLGSIGLGILITLFLWVPRAVRSSIRMKELKRQIANLEKVPGASLPFGQGDENKEP